MSGRTRTTLDLIAGGVAAAYRNLFPAWRGAWASLIMAGLTAGLWRAACRASPHAPTTLALAAVVLIAGLMAKGASFRLAVGAGKPGPGGLQLGRVELNLFLVGLLSLVFLSILALLFLVVLLCTAYAVAAAGPGFVASDVMTWAGAIVGRGRVVFGLVFVAGAGGVIWAATRIALAAPVTVASGELQVLKTWPLTRDKVVPILVSALAVGALPTAALALLSPLTGPLFDIVRGEIIAGLWLPLGVGLVSYWRRQLS